MSVYIKQIEIEGGIRDFEFGQVECNDGFTMSVQASREHYCNPRDNDGPYIRVEVGFPSNPEPLLAPYSEIKGDWDEKTDQYIPFSDCKLLMRTPTQVFPYTPIELVYSVIKRHGGRKKSN